MSRKYWKGQTSQNNQMYVCWTHFNFELLEYDAAFVATKKIDLRNSIPFISVNKSLFLESFIESFIIQNTAFNGVIAKQLVFAKIYIHRICSSYSGFVTYLLLTCADWWFTLNVVEVTMITYSNCVRSSTFIDKLCV